MGVFHPQPRVGPELDYGAFAERSSTVVSMPRDMLPTLLKFLWCTCISLGMIVYVVKYIYIFLIWRMITENSVDITQDKMSSSSHFQAFSLCVW